MGNITRKPNNLAFSYRGINQTPSNGTIANWWTNEFNIGGHYSNGTSRFTCPVAGYYLFGWTSIGNNIGTVTRMYFRVNGSTPGNGDIHLRQDCSGTNQYGTNAMFVLPWYLQVNDYVEIYLTTDNSSAFYPGGVSPGNDYWRFWGMYMQ